MDVNHLLFWMSARRQGSWMQYRSAVEELHLAECLAIPSRSDASESENVPGLPYHQLFRLNLQSLAHVEFFTRGTERGWRVVPPSLAIRRHSDGWFGVLCGARSPRLVSRLVEVSGPVGAEVIPIDGYPDQVLLSSTDLNAILEFASGLGLRIQRDAPSAILVNLPPINHPFYRKQVPLPFGVDWRVERFCVSSLKWRLATRDEAIGSKGELFHFSIGYRHQYLYCCREEVHEVPPRIGKFLALARRHHRVVQYDKSSQTLFLPASCRPPILIERALNLCSGLPAVFEGDSGMLRFRGVTETVAQFASTLLHQEIN